MKVRLGFVTNSSSTSYMIAYKTEELSEKNFLEMFMEHFSYNIIKDEDSLKHYFLDDYGYDDFNEMLEEEGDRYNNYLEKIKAGYCIAFLSVDYDNEEFMEFIEKLNDGKNIIILDTE